MARGGGGAREEGGAGGARGGGEARGARGGEEGITLLGCWLLAVKLVGR